MVLIKLAALLLYGALAYVGITQPLTVWANLSIGLLAFLGITHLGEVLVYRKQIAAAPGSRAWHAVNVLLFGIFHMVIIRRAIRETHAQGA
jgi:uncharacterized protein YhhL (DUF1145 family)